jgi:citrate synthase
VTDPKNSRWSCRSSSAPRARRRSTSRPLRAKTGYVTLDPGLHEHRLDESAITFIDGEQGILRYRGYPIEQLGENSSFVEVAYLLIYGELPNQEELDRFTKKLTRHSLIHEDMKRFFDGYPSTAHPMAILSSMVCSLSSYYPEPSTREPASCSTSTIAIGCSRSSRRSRRTRTRSRSASRSSTRRTTSSYASNFLNMMFSVPAEPYEVDPDVEPR